MQIRAASINWLVDRKKTSYIFYKKFLKQKYEIIAGCSVLHLLLFLSVMTVNEESLSFGLSVGQKKQFEDVT